MYSVLEHNADIPCFIFLDDLCLFREKSVINPDVVQHIKNDLLSLTWTMKGASSCLENISYIIGVLPGLLRPLPPFSGVVKENIWKDIGMTARECKESM